MNKNETLKSYSNEQIQNWADEFSESYFDSPEDGDMKKWISWGVQKGIIQNFSAQKEMLVRKMGMIFAFVYRSDGSEFILEELDFDAISRQTNVPQEEITQIANFMAEIGIIKSRELINRNYRNKGY